MHRNLALVSLFAGLASLPAHAAPCLIDGLGDAAGMNVVTLGDFDGRYSSIDGFSAIGGDATFQSYGVAQSYYSSTGGPVLEVGGDLSATDTQINGGDANVAGICSMTRANVQHGVASCSHTGGLLDASTLAGDMEDISDHLAGQSATHSVSSYSWGTVTLDATGATGEVTFDLDLDTVKAHFSPWVSAINNFEIKAGSGVTVIINVSGDTSIFLQGGGFNLSGGVSAETVLLNFNTQTSLSIKNVGIEASVLAPHAAVSGSWGHLNGTLVADAFDGTTDFRDAAFDGEVCVPDVCVDVLLHCNPSSRVLETVCSADGTFELDYYDARNASYIRFGPGVSSVDMVHLNGVTTQTITGDYNFCVGSWTFNDKLKSVTVNR